MSTICIPIETLLREMLESWDREQYPTLLESKVRQLAYFFEEWYDDKLEEFRLQSSPGRKEDGKDEIC